MTTFKCRPLSYALALAFLGGLALCGGARAQVGPYASNNGVAVPPDANPPPFDGPYKFRKLSHDYPSAPPAHSWLDARPKGPITVDNAHDYMNRLKAYVEPTLRKMIEAPADWDPASNGWYDMPWMGPGDGPGKDEESGREAILGSFTGQIILAKSEAGRELKSDTQNHTIIYYDPMAASTLGDIWKDISHPSYPAAFYREGSLVVKAGGVAATPDEWPVVDGAAIWRVYRPPVQQVIDWKKTNPSGPWPWKPVVTDLRVMQFDIIVKDTEAAPETGWVFTTFVYDRSAPKGTGPWDRLVPLGATWGNDPQYAGYYTGHPPGEGALTQFWRNPDAPKYTVATLGWGGRMSGPIDIAERHGVILVKDQPLGKIPNDADCENVDGHIDVTGPIRVSGCFSCHGTSQAPALTNRMYSSPIKTFGLPLDGQPFCLNLPGTDAWKEWFKNRSGREPQTQKAGADLLKMIQAPRAANAIIPFVRFGAEGRNIPIAEIEQALQQPTQGLDYDMLLMFAMANAETSPQGRGFTFFPQRLAVH